MQSHTGLRLRSCVRWCLTLTQGYFVACVCNKTQPRWWHSAPAPGRRWRDYIPASVPPPAPAAAALFASKAETGAHGVFLHLPTCLYRKQEQSYGLLAILGCCMSTKILVA